MGIGDSPWSENYSFFQWSPINTLNLRDLFYESAEIVSPRNILLLSIYFQICYTSQSLLKILLFTTVTVIRRWKTTQRTQCYGLNVCVSPKFIGWNPNLQCDDFRRWGLWERIRPEVESSWKDHALIKETPERSLSAVNQEAGRILNLNLPT